MFTLRTTATAAVALLAMVQLCPAPPAIIGPIAGAVASGAISGGISAGIANSKRDGFVTMVKRDYPAGISQNSIDLCVQAIDAQGTAVNVYSTGDDCKSYPSDSTLA